MVEQLASSTKRPYSDISDSDSDSEWEYEYSTTETEVSFYVTLDLSSHSNSTLHHASKRRLKHKTNTGIPANDRPPHPITIDNVEVTAPQPPSNQPTSPAQEQPPSPTLDEGPERIQILDLHGDNPLVSYQGAIYSCAWTEPLGTDVLLTAPPDQAPGAAPANGKEASPILAWSRLRLVARPVKLIPHEQEKRGRKEDLLADGTRIPGTEPAPPRPMNLQERLPSPAPALGTIVQPATARESTPDPESSAPASTNGQPNPTADPHFMKTSLPRLNPTSTPPSSASPSAHPPPAPPSVSIPTTTSPPPEDAPPLPLITLPSHASHNRTTQASFLTSLIHAKHARGETDTVTLHAPKPQGTGWRAQKKAKERTAKKREEKKVKAVLVEEGEGERGGEAEADGDGFAGEASEQGRLERGSAATRGRGRPRGRGRARGSRTTNPRITQLREEDPAAEPNPDILASNTKSLATSSGEAQPAVPSTSQRPEGS